MHERPPVAFAMSALLLAGVGIYSVLSYSVTERIPEIGIRMALGESTADVRRGVVGRTALLATIGVAVGTGVSLAGTRLLGSLLYGVEPTDPLTFEMPSFHGAPEYSCSRDQLGGTQTPAYRPEDVVEGG